MERLKSTTKEEKNFDTDFKNQFINQKIEGTDIAFVKVESRESLAPEYVVLIGGFAAGAKEYKSEMKDLVQSGRNVLFTNPVKGIDVLEKDKKVMVELGLSETIQRKVAEVLQLLDHEDIKRADLVGHSQGAIIASVVSALRPGIANDLLLANPAGMHGSDTSARLIGRTARGFLTQTKTNSKRVFTQKGELGRVSKVVGDVLFGGVQMHKSPLYRFSKEISGIVASDIVPLLNNIKKATSELPKSEKTKITLLTSNEDHSFHSKQIEGNIGLHYEGGIPNAFEKTPIDNHIMFVKKDAGHESLMYEKEGILTQILNDKYKK